MDGNAPHLIRDPRQLDLHPLRGKQRGGALRPLYEADTGARKVFLGTQILKRFWSLDAIKVEVVDRKRLTLGRSATVFIDQNECRARDKARNAESLAD